MTTGDATRLAAALTGRFTLVRELGGGGMAHVWLARETALGRDVVIKLVRDGTGLSAERFAREVQLAARLQQANIVPLLTAGDADGVPFYTMPFVAGQSLRARLIRGPLPLAEALDVLRDVARALAYAHSEGVVHRDIKPENILLSAGAAVVTDFGIARALSAARTVDPGNATMGGHLTQAGTSVGTPAYMAPEQALGDAVDARADCYAWGVVAYELLARQHPFAHHTTPPKLIAAHVQEVPAPVPAAVPAAIAALVTQCLAKDVDARPANGAALLAQLTAAMAGVTANTAAGTASRRAARWPVIGGVLVALAAGAVALWQTRAPTAGAAPARTIVVVPFENLGDPADAYFADGVSDEIAGQLARLPGVSVIGRDGVRRVSAAQRPALDIARELGAAWVLSGSVRWARTPGSTTVDGDTRVRIVPALVNVATGVQTWGEPLEERLTDVFRVQGEVAGRVATALSVALTGAQRASLGRAESADPAARDAQLLGRNLLRQRGLGNLRQAEAQFARAIARDSAYARAWAGLAETVLLRPVYGDRDISLDSALARAERAARRSIQLDSVLPEARLAMARLRQTQFRFREALDETDRVLALDSSYVLAWVLRTELLVVLGRPTASVAAARRAVGADPLLPIAHQVRALSFQSTGQADSALASSDRAVALDPEERTWQTVRMGPLSDVGRRDEAVAQCLALLNWPVLCRPIFLPSSSLTDADRAGARRLLDALATSTARDVAITSVEPYQNLGMLDSAFSRLRMAIARREPAFSYLLYAAERGPMGRDPRWETIVGELRRR